ncbi:MAG: glycosyltransferase family 2 protein [Nocardioides sp.]
MSTPQAPTYSLVVPVFNSAQVVGRTIDRILEVFDVSGLDYELILVNDGSPDDSWRVISERARTTPRVVALNLLKNYGQHNANLAGFHEASGEWVITLDDDLQNPPEEAMKLIEHARQGHDVVFGEFESKQAAGYRKLGSKVVSLINRRVFDQPAWLPVSNYRVLHRDVVARICADNTAHPYITGQALLYSHNPSSVPVRHDPRPVGSSNYSLLRILRLVLTILFSYSCSRSGWRPCSASLSPGRVPAGRVLPGARAGHRDGRSGLDDDGGAAGSVQRLHHRAAVHAGEYVIRTLNAVSTPHPFHVDQRVRFDPAQVDGVPVAEAGE